MRKNTERLYLCGCYETRSQEAPASLKLAKVAKDDPELLLPLPLPPKFWDYGPVPPCLLLCSAREWNSGPHLC